MNISSAPPDLKGTVRFEGGLVIQGPDRWLRDGSVAVEGKRIVDVGPREEVAGRHPDSVAVDASEFMLIPGLINAHTHLAMSFFRGLGHVQPDPSLDRSMLETLVFPAEKSLTPELVEALSFSYALGALRSGVTCVGDHYYFSDALARALDAIGMRAMLGECVADLGATFPSEEIWEKDRARIERWPYGPRLKPVVSPHAADTVSRKLLTEMAAFARANGLPLHMHLSQTEGERARVQKREGMSPVAFAADCGALTDMSLAVHLVSVDGEDLRRLSDAGSVVGFCPASQIIFQKLAPIKEFLSRGLPIAVATDAACSNDGADLIGEMKLTALLGRHEGAPRESIRPPKILEMTTRIPARVFGLGDLGSLEAGKAADIVFLRRDVEVEPMRDPVINLVFSCGSAQVRHVMIDGRWVLWNRLATGVDEAEIERRFRDAERVIASQITDLTGS